MCKVAELLKYLGKSKLKTFITAVESYSKRLLFIRQYDKLMINAFCFSSTE
jgi:hypothetical protein